MYQRFPTAVCCAFIASISAFAVSNGFCQQAESPPAPFRVEDQPPADPGPVPVPRSQESISSRALSLAQLEQMAENHNPTLAQAARRVEAVQGQQVQVGLYPNPVVGYQAEEVGDNGRAGQHGMFFRQEIVTSNKLGLNRAVAAHEVQQAEWDLQMQRQRILNDVRSRAYDVLAAQRTMEIAGELVRIGQTAVDVADRLNKARETSLVDVIQARVEANSAKLQLSAASKTHSAAWRRLTIVVGIPGMPPCPLTDSLDEDLPELSWDETWAALLGQSPQLAYAYSGVERARWAVARACAGRTPNIEAGAAIRYNDDSNDTTLSLQVGVPLMVFDRNQGNIMKAHAELAAAQREIERIELRLQDGLADVFRQYDIAREQVEQYRRDILPYAKQALELTRAGYEQGEFTYLELLTAQQTFSRTNLAYVSRLRELWLATVQIDGMLLSGGLEAPGR
jgi:cobalt-zinc-cadmium efflux system outer membrane protein